MTTKQNSRFRKGSGVYTCRGCGKQTRETGNDESSCLLCKTCYDREGRRNELSDEGILSDDEIELKLIEEFGKIEK